MRFKNAHYVYRSALGGEGEEGGAAGGGDGDPGAGGEGGNTLADLLGDNEVSKDPSLANYLTGDVASLAKGYVSAQKLVGADPKHVLKLPSGTGDEHQEAWGQIYGQLGRPEKPDGYTSPESLTDELRESMGLTDETLGSFRELTHKLGLSDAQQSAVLDFYAGMGKEAVDGLATAQQESETARAEALDGLKEQWGDQYDANIAIALDGIKMLGDDANDFQAMLDETGLGDNPALIKMFAKLGAQNQEDAGAGGAGGEGRGTFTGQMTPEVAKAEITRLQADETFTKQWLNEDQPGHDEAVTRMQRLSKMAYPT